MRGKIASIISVLLVFAVLIPCTMSASAAEKPSSWAQTDVQTAIDAGLVPQSLQSQYTQTATRAEFCALAVALCETVTGEPITERKTFADTGDVNVQKAAAIGMVQGVGDNKFDPNADLTREQAATMLSRLADALGQPLPKQSASFADSGAVSTWAIGGVGGVQAAGIMQGVGNNTFAPQDPYTREQSITTMLRLYGWKAPSEPAPAPDTTGQLYPMSALVDEKYLWGYADIGGNFAIAPKYAYASEWNGEHGIVSLPETPDSCFVIDRAEERIAFKFPYEKEPMDTFPLIFDDGVPGVWFAGDFLITSEVLGDPYASNSFFRMATRKYAFSSGFQSYSEGMLCTWYRDNASWFNTKSETGSGYTSYGQIGAFYDGVAVTWGRLVDKKGETVYEYDFFKTPEISVYGMGSNTFVGDFCIFTRNEKDPNGYWGLTELQGVVRADGTAILSGEYEHVRLTPCKQILASKKGEKYSLYDELGKEIYKFETYMTGAFYYDGTGHYLYRATDGNLVVLSVSGAVTAKIPVADDARHEFISGLVRVTEADGRCRYYDVMGKAVIG